MVARGGAASESPATPPQVRAVGGAGRREEEAAGRTSPPGATKP